MIQRYKTFNVTVDTTLSHDMGTLQSDPDGKWMLYVAHEGEVEQLKEELGREKACRIRQDKILIKYLNALKVIKRAVFRDPINGAWVIEDRTLQMNSGDFEAIRSLLGDA